MSETTGTFYAQLAALEQEGTAFVLVILADALGSTPQDTGAKMLVTADGLHTGTVGGGKVEAKALTVAREMLADATSTPRLVNWALKTDVGMTCGGSVKLYFEPHDGADAGAKWPIWIFGAGHVAQALVSVLVPLDCRLTVVDPRREWLDKLPRGRNIRYLEAAEPADLVPTMPDRAFLVCLGKGHAADRPVLQRALALRGRLIVIGLLGGAKGEFPLGALLPKRARVEGSVLRSRAPEEKAALAQSFSKHILGGFDTGAYRPVIDATLPMTDIAEAHARMDRNETFGKLVLAW